jgi:hypothetical protein
MTKDARMKVALSAASDCPTLETLVQSLDLAQPTAERVAAEDHLKNCATCRNELAMFREFESGQELPHEKDDVDWIAQQLADPLARQKPKVVEMPLKWWQGGWSSPVGWSAMAAAAVLIFAVAVNMPWHRPAAPVEQPDVLRSVPLRALSPAGDLTQAPTEFQWSPVNGAAAYVVTVSEVDRTIVYQKKVTNTSLPTPYDVGKLIQPGKTLLWVVRAEDSAGREVMSSGEQSFRLKAPPPK